MTTETGIRPYGPGKFSTILDQYVYTVSLDGGCDEEESIGESGEGWYGLMRNGRTIFRDHDPFLESLTEEEKALLTESAGVIVTEDSQGFVYVRYYATEAELNTAWTELCKLMETPCRDDDEDDDEDES
jgi:hypothetical protein